MKKIKLLICLLLIIACSNEDEISKNELGNSGMIKAIIFKTDISPHESDSKTSYFYSEGNKIKRIEYLKEKTVDYGTVDYKHHFFYENNLIIRVESFYRTKDITNLNVVYYFEYDSNQRIIKFTRDSNRDGIEIHNYEYLNNGNISDNYKKENMNNFQTNILEFDINGNLTYDGYYERFTYDNKTSPYFGIIGFDKLFFVNMNSLQGSFYPTYFNNLKTRSYNSIVNNYSYEYNSESKPIKTSSNRVIFEYY